MSDTENNEVERVGPFYYVGENGFEAWGFTFPSGYTVLEWDPDTVPEDAAKIDGHHQSIYHSVEDFRTVCTGEVDWGISPDQFVDAGDTESTEVERNEDAAKINEPDC